MELSSGITIMEERQNFIILVEKLLYRRGKKWQKTYMINLDLIEKAITVIGMIECVTIDKALTVKDIINRV